jgi:hypothetical protein
MVEALRWITWGIVYLAVTLTALVLIVGSTPLPVWLRWVMLGVIVSGLALDARSKWRGEQA